jgi:6-phosphogluconolactonase
MNQTVQKGITASIQELLKRTLAENRAATLMMTGGRGAECLYRKWHETAFFQRDARSSNLFLTDERCVPSDHSDSNYRLIKQVLFAGQPPRTVTLHPMKGDVADFDSEADRYGELLPESIDFMLLSMGEDGHIASLFPHSPALKEMKRKVVPIYGPKFPHQRLTITPRVIKNAKQIFVLAVGDEKRDMYQKALREPENIDAIPARLVLDRTWIFDLDGGAIL